MREATPPSEPHRADLPEWLAELPLVGGPIVRFRHVRPEDEPLVAAAINSSSRETLLPRFFSPIRSVAPDQLHRMLVFDSTHETCIVGVTEENANPRIICGARYVKLPKPQAAETFDTEMLSLNLTGGGAGGPIMIRESPTKQSPGEVHITPAPGGFMIDSFFDIFTELSLDGGQNWSPATTPVRVELQIDPGAADTILTNPRRVGGKPTFSLNTELGLLYLIECKGDLGDPDWFTISGRPGSGDATDTTDYLGDDGQPRYYRAKVEEPPDPQE